MTPTVTTDYQVAVHQAATGSQIEVDTIIGFTITIVDPPFQMQVLIKQFAWDRKLY